MIRVFDDVMGKILTVLAFVRTREGKRDLRAIATDVLDQGMLRWGSGDGVDNITIEEIDHWARHTRDRQSLDELINDIGKQTLQRRARLHGGERTLIDTIVDTLKLDTAAPQLTGRTLRDLRTAILLPSELAGVNKRLRSRTMACSNCHRDIASGEATTASTDENGAMFIYCCNCHRPNFVKCADTDCNSLVEIGNETRFLQEFRCDTHRAGAVAQPGEALAEPLIPPGGGLRPNPFGNLLRQRQTRIPPPPPRNADRVRAEMERAEQRIREQLIVDNGRFRERIPPGLVDEPMHRLEPDEDGPV